MNSSEVTRTVSLLGRCLRDGRPFVAARADYHEPQKLKRSDLAEARSRQVQRRVWQHALLLVLILVTFTTVCDKVSKLGLEGLGDLVGFE